MIFFERSMNNKLSSSKYCILIALPSLYSVFRFYFLILKYFLAHSIINITFKFKWKPCLNLSDSNSLKYHYPPLESLNKKETTKISLLFKHLHPLQRKSLLLPDSKTCHLQVYPCYPPLVQLDINQVLICLGRHLIAKELWAVITDKVLVRLGCFRE